MRYFLDTEHTDDGERFELISIAVVSEDGREYYAAVNDYDSAPVTPDNVGLVDVSAGGFAGRETPGSWPWGTLRTARGHEYSRRHPPGDEHRRSPAALGTVGAVAEEEWVDVEAAARQLGLATRLLYATRPAMGMLLTQARRQSRRPRSDDTCGSPPQGMDAVGLLEPAVAFEVCEPRSSLGIATGSVTIVHRAAAVGRCRTRAGSPPSLIERTVGCRAVPGYGVFSASGSSASPWARCSATCALPTWTRRSTVTSPTPPTMLPRVAQASTPSQSR